MKPAGEVSDSHELSRRAREYAADVIYGDEWPLNAEHVDLSRVTFETSTRMRRKHGVCSCTGTGDCTIRLSERTYQRAGFDSMKETVRHELVHVYQQQTEDVDAGHGPSFQRWVEPLSLSGSRSTHYEKQPEDFKYRFYCLDGCGFISGRHRWSVAVRRAINGKQVCGNCQSTLRVETANGVLDDVPDGR